MNKKLVVLLALVFFMSAAALFFSVYAQCSGHSSSSSGSEQHALSPESAYWGKGRSVNAVEIQSINILLNNKEKYIDKIIVIGGKISSECPSGHWFYIEDNGGSDKIYAAPMGFTLPQITGKKVKVYGNWTKQNDKWLIEAKRVELVQ